MFYTVNSTNRIILTNIYFKNYNKFVRSFNLFNKYKIIFTYIKNNLIIGGALSSYRRIFFDVYCYFHKIIKWSASNRFKLHYHLEFLKHWLTMITNTSVRFKLLKTNRKAGTKRDTLKQAFTLKFFLFRKQLTSLNLKLLHWRINSFISIIKYLYFIFILVFNYSNSHIAKLQTHLLNFSLNTQILWKKNVKNYFFTSKNKILVQMLKYFYEIFYYMLFWFRNLRDYLFYCYTNLSYILNMRSNLTIIKLNMNKGGYLKLWTRNMRKVLSTIFS